MPWVVVDCRGRRDMRWPSRCIGGCPSDTCTRRRPVTPAIDRPAIDRPAIGAPWAACDMARICPRATPAAIRAQRSLATGSACHGPPRRPARPLHGSGSASPSRICIRLEHGQPEWLAKPGYRARNARLDIPQKQCWAAATIVWCGRAGESPSSPKGKGICLQHSF